MEYGKEVNHFGEVDIWHENDDCGIYLLRIPPGATIPAHFHAEMEEGELIMSDESQKIKNLLTRKMN